MLAFAPPAPLSHTQSADSAVSIRSRPTTRSSHSTSALLSATPPSQQHNNFHRHPLKQPLKVPKREFRAPDDPHSSKPTSQPSSPKHSRSSPVQAAPRSPRPSQPLDLRPLQKIHEQDATKLLQLLASLLERIATANDQLRSSQLTSSLSTVDSPDSPTVHRPPIWTTLTSASRQAFSTPTSCLTFHARNIPTISLEAYLLRILKYCPTTNEVFLSLLVYFDRMSKLAFEATGKSFAIDSYNVHRLVIAGVTVASKFFSDVFYTNTRYAKVGGLPQSELDQLELQFLFLNDFRLAITAEEMQRYAEQLQIYSRCSEADLDAIPPFPATHASGAPRGVITTPMQKMGNTPSSSLPASFLPSTSIDNAKGESVTAPHRTSTESGVETEEEGGETDDEPTIRAPSSVDSETQSLCTVGSEDVYSEAEDDRHRCRTPENSNSATRSSLFL